MILLTLLCGVACGVVFMNARINYLAIKDRQRYTHDKKEKLIVKLHSYTRNAIEYSDHAVHLLDKKRLHEAENIASYAREEIDKGNKIIEQLNELENE